MMSCVAAFIPFVAKWQPVAMMTISAPYSSTSWALSRELVWTWTFLSLSSWIWR